MHYCFPVSYPEDILPLKAFPILFAVTEFQLGLHDPAQRTAYSCLRSKDLKAPQKTPAAGTAEVAPWVLWELYATTAISPGRMGGLSLLSEVYSTS